MFALYCTSLQFISGCKLTVCNLCIILIKITDLEFCIMQESGKLFDSQYLTHSSLKKLILSRKAVTVNRLNGLQSPKSV